MKQYFEYFVVKSFIILAKILPNSLVYTLFKYISILFFYISKKRRVLTCENIKRAFKDMECGEVKKLALESFVGVSRTIAEIMMLINNKIDIDKMLINKDELVEYLKKYDVKNRASIIMTAHYGNWEVMAKVAAKLGYPLLTISRRGDNGLIEEKISKPLREMFGNKNAYKEGAIAAIVKAFKKKHLVAILIDQSSNHVEGVKGKFFGSEVYSVSSVAKLKLKYDPLILPIYVKRVENGRYKLRFFEPVEYKADEFENEEEKIVAITQKYNDILQTAIEESPKDWFWMHDRWKIKKELTNKGCC
jgi:KDO2-lipid IV(A) lauroyltransferase